MKKILMASQMRQADQHYVDQDAHSSHGLMENAATAFSGLLMSLIPDKQTSILVVCGSGNNGGDGLAIARILQCGGYDSVQVLVVRLSDTQTMDFSINFERLQSLPVTIDCWNPNDELPMIFQDVLIDALLGSGLNRPLEGEAKRIVNHLNQSGKRVIAVDIPTGLPADGHLDEEHTVLQASDVICFQRPKLSFFMPEVGTRLGRFHTVPIGLCERFMDRLESDFYWIQKSDVAGLYRRRSPFSHKGTYGHALLIAGNPRTLGAGLLCAEACVYTGAGLTSLCISEHDTAALYSRLPEVMWQPSSTLENDWGRYASVGIGPGLGEQASCLNALLRWVPKPLVLDADALNYLSRNKPLIQQLPPHTILTPHVKEFDRLFGTSSTWFDRVKTAQRYAQEHQIIIILKNQYTFIALPDRRILINTTGNPAMASGGMGDVLTGILTALLAQGYSPQDASVLGVYIHGRAGDSLHTAGMEIVPATRLIQELPYTLGQLGL